MDAKQVAEEFERPEKALETITKILRANPDDFEDDHMTDEDKLMRIRSTMKTNSGIDDVEFEGEKQ